MLQCKIPFPYRGRIILKEIAYEMIHKNYYVML